MNNIKKLNELIKDVKELVQEQNIKREEKPDLFNPNELAAIYQVTIHIEYFSMEFLLVVKDYHRNPNSPIKQNIKNLSPDLLKEQIDVTIALVKQL